MSEQLPSLEETRRRYLERLAGAIDRVETVPIEEALGRITAENVISGEDVPGFSRSSVDGYAVRARDTFGASSGSPAYLNVVGEIRMGEEARVKVGPGQAVYIATGGMMPEGADAVVMVEYTSLLDETTLEVVKAVAPGEEIIVRGEDVAKGGVLLPRGHRIRPQDIGALAGIGVLEVKVYGRPKVAIVATGDEIVPSTSEPGPASVRDSNAWSLAAAVRQDGGEPWYYGIVPDEEAELEKALKEALAGADMLLISGGSSKGKKDYTHAVVSRLGEPGIVQHGVAIKPGKPVLLALVGRKPVIGLPGNPVSALVIYDQLARPALRSLMGARVLLPRQGSVRAVLAEPVQAPAERDEFVRMRLETDGKEIKAVPVFAKSNNLGSLVRAHGLTFVERGRALEAGTPVEVIPFSGFEAGGSEDGGTGSPA